MQTFLIQFVEKVQQLDNDFRTVKYKTLISKVNNGYKIDTSEVMKEIPSFIKFIKDYFFEIKTKGKEGGRVYTKCLIMYNVKFQDLAKIVKE